MRRPPALMLMLALVASMLGLASFSPASAVPPGDTPDTGSLYVDPVTPSEGGKVKLTANFPNGVFDVTFYKQVNGGEWTEIDTDRSNSSGNAYLFDYQVNEAQDVYARITSGSIEGRTEVDTITPTPPEVVMPTGPVRASFTTDPATYADGDEIRITANFPSGVFGVTLYQETAPDVWTEVGFDQSNSSGNAYINYSVDGTQEVFARKSNGERTEVRTIAPSPEVTLSIQRDCTGNECGDTATAIGTVDPATAGQQFVLQSLSSTWQQVGDPATTGADGTLEIQLDIGDLSQWTTESYRLSAADESGPAAISNTVSFMPGPEELGKNVLRVDVEDGIFPTKKGPEYKGEASLSTNGEEFLTDFEVDEFGVRGYSTSGYVKKPFKLKFEESPKDTGVFGMDADKSWTLLASWLDRSFVRDKVGLELGRRMENAWTPDSRYVELFVNDQYRGAYLMTESVKIDGDRVDVDKKQGMVMETDGKSVEDSKLGFKTSKGIILAFKDPDERKTLDDGSVDPEGVTSAKLSAIKARVNAFESKLYSSSTREQYVDYLDVDDALDFYFIREMTKERDGDMYRSNYFSWDPSGKKSLSDNKFHFGPAWDFDRSAGITGENDAVHRYVDSPSGFYLRGTGTHSEHPTYRTHWFVQLFKSSSFNDAAEVRWDAKRSEFGAAEQIARDAAAALGAGADNDRQRWPQDRRYEDHGSYQDEVDFVADWYEDRFNWMDGQLN